MRGSRASDTHWPIVILCTRHTVAIEDVTGFIVGTHATGHTAVLAVSTMCTGFITEGSSVSRLTWSVARSAADLTRTLTIATSHRTVEAILLVLTFCVTFCACIAARAEGTIPGSSVTCFVKMTVTTGL